MKFHILTFLSLFFLPKSQILIKYSSTVNREIIKSQLWISENQSIYTDFSKKIKKGTEYLDENGTLSGEYVDREINYYKDYSGKTVYYPSPISYNRASFIYQKNDLEWEINDNITKQILGYTCVQAKTKYKGRNYTAYFTKEMKYNDGPRVFWGLPGVILELAEDTGKLNVIARSVDMKTKQAKQIDFDISTAITWDKALEIAKQNYKAKQQEVYEKFGGIARTDFSNSLETYDLND